MYVNCTFAGNIASGNGAAVFQEATPGSLTRCTLANGRAQVGFKTLLLCQLVYQRAACDACKSHNRVWCLWAALVLGCDWCKPCSSDDCRKA